MDMAGEDGSDPRPVLAWSSNPPMGAEDDLGLGVICMDVRLIAWIFDANLCQALACLGVSGGSWGVEMGVKEGCEVEEGLGVAVEGVEGVEERVGVEVRVEAAVAWRRTASAAVRDSAEAAVKEGGVGALGNGAGEAEEGAAPIGVWNMDGRAEKER